MFPATITSWMIKVSFIDHCSYELYSKQGSLPNIRVPVQDMAHYVPQPTSMRHRDNSVGLGGIFEPGEVK